MPETVTIGGVVWLTCQYATTRTTWYGHDTPDALELANAEALEESIEAHDNDEEDTEFPSGDISRRAWEFLGKYGIAKWRECLEKGILVASCLAYNELQEEVEDALKSDIVRVEGHVWVREEPRTPWGENLRDDIQKLAIYPVLGESRMSEIEMEHQAEQLADWGVWEIRKLVEKLHPSEYFDSDLFWPEDENLIEEYWTWCESSSTYPEGSGANVSLHEKEFAVYALTSRGVKPEWRCPTGSFDPHPVLADYLAERNLEPRALFPLYVANRTFRTPPGWWSFSRWLRNPDTLREIFLAQAAS